AGALSRALLDGREDLERQELDALRERAPRLADVLSVDLEASSGDVAALVARLGRRIEAREPSARLGVLLALASVLEASGDSNGAIAALARARELSPGDPTILRPLAALQASTAPMEAASAWL